MISVKTPGSDNSYSFLLPTTALLSRVGGIEPVPVQADSGATDPYPVPPPLPSASPQVGRLTIPTFGAARFSVGTYLIDSLAFAALKVDMGVQNKLIVSYTDAEDDDAETARKFTLYLLAARPLAQAADPDKSEEVDAYLLTLVDLRYYWQFMAGGDCGDSPSWAGVLETLGTQLGVSLTHAAVSADYGTPGSLWAGAKTQGLPTAVLLDAAAALVNGRVVINPDTEAVSVIFAGAGSADVLSWAADTEQAQRIVAGGLVDDGATVLGEPKDLSVNFPEGDTETATINANSPAGSLVVDAMWEGTSGGDRTTYAAKFATDWELLQHQPLDAVYAGFVVPPATGFNYLGWVELYHTAFSGVTCVRRGPINYPQLVRRQDISSRLGFFARLTTTSGGKWKFFALTLDGSGTWVDDGSESAGFVAVPSTADGTTFGTMTAGTRVWMWTSKQTGFFEFLPTISGATRFGRFARLDSTSGGKWKWQELILDISGNWVTFGSVSAGYSAVPSPVGPVSLSFFANPVAELRVWLWDSVQPGFYEFLPEGYADSTHPGLVSTLAQEYSGAKTFLSPITATGVTPGTNDIVIGWGDLRVNATYGTGSYFLIDTDAGITYPLAPGAGVVTTLWVTGETTFGAGDGSSVRSYAIQLNGAFTTEEGDVSCLLHDEWVGADGFAITSGGGTTGPGVSSALDVNISFGHIFRYEWTRGILVFAGLIADPSGFDAFTGTVP